MLVSLGTTTGASTAPPGLRLTGRSNGQGGIRDGRHREPKQRQQQRQQTITSEWTRPESRRGGCRGGRGECCSGRQHKRARRLTPGFFGISTMAGIGRWGRAKTLPRQQRHKLPTRPCFSSSSARRRRPLWWDGSTNQSLSSTSAEASQFVAQAFPREQEPMTPSSGFGGSERLLMQMRKKPKYEGGNKTALLYGRV